MSRRRFSDQKIEAILKEIDAGKSAVTISHKYGVSERTVYRWKAAHKTPVLDQTLPPGKAKAQLEDPTAVRRITDHLGDLPDWKRNHVAARVAELAQAVFGRPGRRRPATLHRVLREAREQLRLLLDHLDQVGEDAWMYALVEVLWEESAHRGHLQCLLATLDEAIDVALVAQSDSGKKVGGQYRDPRIGQFITSLAMIYRQEAKAPPRHTTDKRYGLPKSDFNHFVEACIRIFYPSNHINWTAVREQMRFITVIDWNAFTTNS